MYNWQERKSDIDTRFIDSQPLTFTPNMSYKWWQKLLFLKYLHGLFIDHGWCCHGNTDTWQAEECGREVFIKTYQ